MDKYTIYIQKNAQKELEGIYTYIAQNCMEPEIAKNILQEIQETISSLETMPAIYPLQHRQTIRGKNVRQVPVKNFVVFYKIYERQKEVVIIAIRHSSSIR